MSAHANNILDYAIVGGGITGIYSGWRLLHDAAPGSPKPRIALFEMSERLGGRLLTLVPPLIPDARVELGGMRYIDPAHAWVSSLVEHLGMATEILPADEPQNICYIRGRMLRSFELTDATKLPYQLRPDVRTESALGNLTAYAATRVLAGSIENVVGVEINHWKELSTKLTPEDWRDVVRYGTFDGTPLWDLPLRYLMARALGHEALELAQDSGGYDSIVHTWNAADGFPWNVGDYGPLVSYRHLVDGYDQLPRTLAEQFDAAGGVLYMNTRLARFTSDTPESPIVLTLVQDGVEHTVVTRRLILALPRRSLELIEPSGPILGPDNPRVAALIRSVVPIPLFKLAICYTRPWWEDLAPVDPGNGQLVKITSGRSTTDLPVRQCIYWKVDPTTGHAVVLIYDDGWDLDYWADLRQADATGAADAALDVDDITTRSAWSRFKAPPRMVDEVHRQLLEMHGITDPASVPKPYAAAFRDWGEDPFGGGANFWPVGVKSYEVSEQIVQPHPPYRVYICGEAYSHAQGWVEGCLVTAEDMLQRHFGLQPPAWKSSDPAAADRRP